jgi:DNA-directed RNA polymerase specialized sigma24 family protein
MELSDLYDRHAPQLFAVALRITSDRNTAARALEETFALLRGYDARFGSPEAWLLRTVRDRALLQQDRSASTTVDPMVGGPPTAKQLVEEAFYRGRTASDLARAHGLEETEVRRLLHDGIADLRRRVATSKAGSTAGRHDI